MAEIVRLTCDDERVRSIITELQAWPGDEIKSHKSVDHPLHKLSFLAELGFTSAEPGIANILEKIMSNQSEEGPFQILINIPKHFGGTGLPIKTWVLCDTPLVAYAAIKLNSGELNPAMKKAVDYLASRVSENGWHCLASAELGKFRGPGRKDDPCPYATLLMLHLLSLTHGDDYRQEKQIGIQTLLNLWDRRQVIKPYLFGMGSDFKKLKLPFVWYDILHVVEILSRYPEAVSDSRFHDMFQAVISKRTVGGYVPESVYLKSSQWDFGQKKKPSDFLNAVIERIEARIHSSATMPTAAQPFKNCPD
ncbi:MAG: hypothetical protein ACOY90_10900 [Candidatus Zhuqueibacterota bacterium]